MTACVGIGYYLRDTRDSTTAIIAPSPSLAASAATGPRLEPAAHAQLVRERAAVDERLARLANREREMDADVDELARRLERVRDRERVGRDESGGGGDGR